ncbi:MAG TPA: acyl carrier protein [Solidesulfovibrio magneticus]|jgi:acyl carrier protein|nr:acyl carrier protein [Solidesulfovibrio magneticus]
MDNKLAVLLADIFGMKPAEMRADLKKEDVGSWDSLKQMDLVLTLEREYDIALEIPDIVEMTSVAAIETVLRQKGVVLEH